MYQLLLAIGLIAVAVVAFFLFFTPPDPEASLLRFVESTLEKGAVLRVEAVRAPNDLEALASKVYLAQLLGKAGYTLSSANFYKNRFEEEAVSRMEFAKFIKLSQVDRVRYTVSIEADQKKLSLSVKDLKTDGVKSQDFAVPNTYVRILGALREVHPEVKDIKLRLEGTVLKVTAVLNHPFAQSLTVSVDGKSIGKHALTGSEFSFEVPNVSPGRRLEIVIRPLNYAGVGLTEFKRAFLVEPAPKPVDRITYEIAGGRITYKWTHGNPPLQELRFVVETPFGTHVTEANQFVDELRLGKLYEVRVRAVARFGESEAKSITVKTPPSKPEVRAFQEGSVLKVTLKNTCDYPVSFVVRVDGQVFNVVSDTFEFQIPNLGATYRLEISAVSDGVSSEPQIVTVQTKK